MEEPTKGRVAQTPNTKHPARLGFQALSLRLFWSLVFDVWSFAHRGSGLTKSGPYLLIQGDEN
jgi:hypothetical protein